MFRIYLTILMIGCCFTPILIGQTSSYFFNNNAQISKYPLTNREQVLIGLDVLLSEKQHLLKGKRIGLVTNHTGRNLKGESNYLLLNMMDDVHLSAIFTPEHGFYGDVSAGQKIDNQDTNGLPTIYSLYGKTRKPTPDMLKDIDLLIYDIQDIGARFYTYISTLGLVMESAAEAGIPMLILDRPTPIGGKKIEGPILDLYYKSFVGMYPIPIRYGLTCGELAQMIAGEGWILFTPELEIIKMIGWERQFFMHNTDLTFFPPSPNIGDEETAVIYPGMCLFEGTNISEGRGTDYSFKQIGAPWINGKILSQNMNSKNLPGVEFEPISFTPKSIPGKAIHPKYQNKKCQGVFIRIIDFNQYNSVATGLHLLTEIRNLYTDKIEIKYSIQKLWGNNDLNQLKEYPINPDSLLETYENEIQLFKVTSSKYYLYD